MSVEAPKVEAAAARDERILTRKTLVYRLCHWSSLLYCKLWHRIRVEGLENIPRAGGAVLASNHQSHIDILVFGGSVPRHVSFVARDTLDDARWLAFVLRQCGAVLVKRGTRDRKARRAMGEQPRAGNMVAVCPERT